jgi:lipid II:glycine glycyltransferase (peptidoglycan interpeptide bridge formation enzyme)
MIYYRTKNLIRIAEVWYNASEGPEKKCDVIKFKFVGEKKDGAELTEDLFTLVLDLQEDTETLFSKIKKNTRYEINRSKERDNVRCGTFFALKENNRGKISEYIDYFNEFTRLKNRSPLSFSDLKQFYDQGTLCIRRIANQETSEVFTVHAYVAAGSRARLFQSSSHFRGSDDPEAKKLTARANRYLHWDDILYFKAMGLGSYDFGGWYGGQEDREKLAINVFKESFGGEKQREYSYTVPVTPAGRIALGFQKIIKKMKKPAAGSGASNQRFE